MTLETFLVALLWAVLVYIVVDWLVSVVTKRRDLASVVAVIAAVLAFLGHR